MASSNGLRLERAVLATLPTDHMPTDADIDALLASLRKPFPVDDDEFEAIRVMLLAKLTISLDPGTSITKEDYRPWLAAKKAEIDPFYWDRYRQFLALTHRWPPLVLNTLDQVTDEMLDLFGDPHRPGEWSRKGLIFGDVQSGKTATYTALCCKAADAGYRLIILLTGTIESLRRQTQERLDEGFVGRDSFEVLKSTIKTDLKIGVGLIDGRRLATVFTSRSRDFSKIIANQLGLSLANSREPVLLVCKKNAKILENLRTWLQKLNADSGGRIRDQLVLIDDEADSASINTSAQQENATRTNKEIRQLLKLFERSVYVGVTATPFANVFINPDTEDEMIGDDLFPRDFIYSLEAPSNYIGPEAVFQEERENFLRNIDDAEQCLPLTHKISFDVQCLPPSLHDALKSFLITTTLRDLRGEGPTHRSMLVNVSRFTGVQDRVANLLHAELGEFQREVRLYAALHVDEACRESMRVASLRTYWLDNYNTSEVDWKSIQHGLNRAVQPIIVKSVNQRAGAASLDYKIHKDTGMRVIAVGGNSLSRGLTLEGLSTSYFYRNSHMYDTLLQMGRWFGYRPGYDDLCRLWLSDDAASWYAHITEATAELRAEFKRMRSLGLTPKDFGLKVRSHPDSLIVTARNKMRLAKDYIHYVSLSGAGLETTRLRLKLDVNSSNYKAAARFVEHVKQAGRVRPARRNGWYVWGDVPKDLVARFLQQFESDPLNFNFNMDAIAEFLERTDDSILQLWDVALVGLKASEKLEEFAGLTVRPVRRFVHLNDKEGFLLISGSKRRVGAGDDEAEGLTDADVATVRTAAGKRAVYAREYRALRVRPLLLLYLIRGYTGNQKEKTEQQDFRPQENPLVAISLSFPRFDDSAVAKRAAYKINVIEFRTRFETEEGDEEELIEDDELD